MAVDQANDLNATPRFTSKRAMAPNNGLARNLLEVLDRFAPPIHPTREAHRHPVELGHQRIQRTLVAVVLDPLDEAVHRRRVDAAPVPLGP